ncbi:MAG: PEP-CTERM sorting domain-containing protein [Phycisphaerales bacterium JB040]
MNRTLTSVTGAVICLLAGQASAQTYLTDFESGTDGWTVNGAATVVDTGGPNGNALEHYQYEAFWIDIANTTNADFLGDYTAKAPMIEVSVDIKTNYLGSPYFESPYPRELSLELRDYDNEGAIRGGYPWASVYSVNPTLLSSTEQGWVTFTWTIDTTATELPDGWGGYGAEDPVTYEPMLPAGTAFSDLLSGVDEIVFSTAVPGYFYTYSTFDLQVDNIRFTLVPAPASAGLLGLGGLVAARRRRA